MGTHGQQVLVRTRGGDADTRLSAVREAILATLEGWRNVTESSAPDLDDELDGGTVRSSYLECCRDSPWLLISDSELDQWREDVSAFAERVSRRLADPVLALAYGDEGVGLQIFVRGEDRGRWATDWGDDARLDPDIPEEEWRASPEALAAILGDEHRDALAELPELAAEMTMAGPQPLFDRLGLTLDPADAEVEFGGEGDPIFTGISALIEGAMTAAQTGESIDDFPRRLGLPENAAEAPHEALRALGERTLMREMRAREEHVPNPTLTLWFERD